LPCALVSRTLGRLRNQVENRVRAKGGSRRCEEMPAVFSMSLRTVEPAGAPIALFITGAMVVPSLPMMSVRAINCVVALSRAETWPVAWRMASTRSIKRGKSSFHS
jgi:hypothetical protein